MRAVLLGPLAAGGLSPDRLASLGILTREGREDSLKVAVDGGLDAYLRMGIRPHIAVGDWDSVTSFARGSLRRIPHLTLARAKDRSDLWHACRAAHALGATELVCLGVSGGRPDHHLAMILDLSEAEAELPGLRSVSARGLEADYYFVSGGKGALSLRLEKGRVVSVFSLKGVAQGVVMRGFRYRPADGTLGSSSQGLSNQVMKTGICGITLRRGRLVVIAPPLKKP